MPARGAGAVIVEFLRGGCEHLFAPTTDHNVGTQLDQSRAH